MAYCEESDLMTGDLTIGPRVDKPSYIDGAADEMDVILGILYETPISVGGLSDSSAKLLKKINRFMASGRLIMALAAGGEDSELHAYGWSLVQQAQADLHCIANGSLKLEGATAKDGALGARGPSIVNRDNESATEVFEQFVYREGNVYWAPGESAL